MIIILSAFISENIYIDWNSLKRRWGSPFFWVVSDRHLDQIAFYIPDTYSPPPLRFLFCFGRAVLWKGWWRWLRKSSRVTDILWRSVLMIELSQSLWFLFALLWSDRWKYTMGDKTTGTNVILRLKGHCYYVNISTASWFLIKSSIRPAKYPKILVIS